MRVSVIIPTHNRRASVLRTLKSLREQSLPSTNFDVIVVDDGSVDDTPTIAGEKFPFEFTYLRQENQGATIARNNGVQHSRGEVLVFIDDDITISPHTLEALAHTVTEQPRTVAMGVLIQRTPGEPTVYARVMLAAEPHRTPARDVVLDCVECNTELLAVRRADFLALGMLQDPTHGAGWPNWDDVDFGYRTAVAGYRLVQVAQAVGTHWDYSLSDLRTASRRWMRAGRSAIYLFETHPGLRGKIPMLVDKMPIQRRADSSKLIVRKILRRVASTWAVIKILELMTAFFERVCPRPAILGALYRWVHGGYMAQGIRAGLRELGKI